MLISDGFLQPVCVVQLDRWAIIGEFSTILRILNLSLHSLSLVCQALQVVVHYFELGAVLYFWFFGNVQVKTFLGHSPATSNKRLDNFMRITLDRCLQPEYFMCHRTWL